MVYWMVCVAHRSRSTMAVGIEQIWDDRGRCNLAERRTAGRTMTVTAALRGHLLRLVHMACFELLVVVGYLRSYPSTL